ncbi:MAG: VWA domain-containing protein, partial [Aeromicrobium sp.]
MSRIGRSIRPSVDHIGGADGERGQILVLFTIVLVVILAFTALVVDLGVLRNNRQTLANAVDAGALAGGTLMPVDGAAEVGAVTAIIDSTVDGTYPGLTRPANYDIEYKCLIGTGAGNTGTFDQPDIDAFIPLDCDPTPSLGHPPLVGDFEGAGKTRTIDCYPDRGDKCNVVVVAGNVTTGYTFARVVGVNEGNTGVVQSAACKGYCGILPDTPFDVMIVLDTSGSMLTNSNGQTRLHWAKESANQLITSLETARGVQRVGAVRYSGNVTSTTPPPASVVSPLTSDFTSVRTAINGLTGNGNTPLKQGMALGASTLNSGARAGVTQVIVFVSDGRPWPDGSTTRPNSTELASFRASADQIYSIAIGQGGSSSSAVDLPLMRSLAKPDVSTHFFNVVEASNLPDVFQQIAVDLIDPKSHLINVYPAPIVDSVGSGGTVAITGKYFTGATRVTFGGANATFSINSDTSITATAPTGASGQTVHVRVTTSGGTSSIGSD